MSVEAVKVEAPTSSGTRIRVPVLLERKDGRIYFWDGKVGTKTRYGLSSEVKAMRVPTSTATTTRASTPR